MISIPLEDVQQLLRSEELASIQLELARTLRVKVLPERFATPLQRELAFAGIPVETVYQHLRNHRDRLIRFVVLHLQQPDDPALVDGEFPEGEGPDPAERSEPGEVLGLENGFAVDHLIYIVLADRGREHLHSFIKWRRIPSAQKATRELIALAKRSLVEAAT